MQARRREHREGRVGTVVAACALCSTDLLRVPEQSSSTDHSRRAPAAVQGKILHGNTHKRTEDRREVKEEDKTRREVIGETVRGGKKHCTRFPALSWMDRTSSGGAKRFMFYFWSPFNNLSSHLFWSAKSKFAF